MFRYNLLRFCLGVSTRQSRSNSSGLSSSSGSGSITGGRSYSSGGLSCSACSNLHSGALTDPASTHTGASKVLSVEAAATTRLVPAFVAGSGATSPTAQLSFTLDSGASKCFFRDCTDLTPLHTPVTVALADPSVGSVVAERVPCPTAPFGFLTGYYTLSFARNLVGVSHLHEFGVVTTFPLHKPVASCTVGATRAPLATFHREPSFGLYSLHTGSHHTGSGQVRSGQVRSSLQESLAPLPHSPAPLCTPCVEGRQRAAPHSSSFPPTTAPLQTLHLDVWSPSPVLGPRQERYFLIVVDDYSHYTTVFPLQRKADVPIILKLWLLARGGVQGMCGLRLHSDRGGEFSSTRLETLSGGDGGAVAEGEGTGAAGARRPSSRGIGSVRVETTSEEDTAVSTQRPRPASPPGFPSVPQFPPHLLLRLVITKPGDVPPGGTKVPRGVVCGGSGSGGARARDMSTATPTPRTVRFVTRVPCLDRVMSAAAAVSVGALGESRGGVTATAATPAPAAAAAVLVGASGESRGGVMAAPAAAATAATTEAAAASIGASGESRGVTTAPAGVVAATAGEGRAGVPAAAAGVVAATAGQSRGRATGAATNSPSSCSH
ncbi:unnamed protein product [Closterium sp. NIES-53]